MYATFKSSIGEDAIVKATTLKQLNERLRRCRNYTPGSEVVFIPDIISNNSFEKFTKDIANKFNNASVTPTYDCLHECGCGWTVNVPIAAKSIDGKEIASISLVVEIEEFLNHESTEQGDVVLSAFILLETEDGSESVCSTELFVLDDKYNSESLAKLINEGTDFFNRHY